MEDEDEEYNNIVERILAGTMKPSHLPFQVLARITENFSRKRKIGEGGFGVVYKGVLHNQNIIAVKRIKMNGDTVDDDGIFLDELEKLLVLMQHQNVVRFLGFCYQSCHEGIKAIEPQKLSLSQTRERLLCFEYISNGSLDKHITDELRGLEWNMRFQIIKGICQGLQYLHEEKEIIHMDLNPKNVMVDDYMVPKITDFGLAIRLAENAHTTGQLFGTRGYCAPDGKKSVKCDIYSLGVIIVELVTGLKGIIPVDKTNVLRRWKWSYKWNIRARQVPLQAEQVTKCIEIGERCMQEEPNNRPHSISEIISNLNEIENTSSGDIFAVDLIKTSDDDMLGIKPLELRFGSQINEQISEVKVTLTNETSNCVAFNIEARYPLKCSKRKGIVQGSNGTCVVFITLEARKATTLSSDKVIVQSTKVKEGLTDKDVKQRMFNHEARNVVDEVKLTVVYDVPVSKDDNITSKDQRLNFHPPHKTLLKYKYRQASDNQAVDVDTGVMGPLLPKDMKHLKNVPEDIEDDLSTVLQKKYDDFEPNKKWVRNVKELSYDTEDPVDVSLRVCTEGSEPTTHQQELQKTIEDITERAHRLADRCPEQTAGDYVATPGANKKYDPRRLPSRKGHIKLVGINRTRDELLKRLLGWDDGVFTQQLKIMSIFGDGGLGKTTLARAVYDSLAATYILKAFVMVGRNRGIIWVLEEILLRLNEVKYSDIHTKRWDNRKLFEELRHVLEKKRYLIVIDDIWDKESWEIIMKAFRNHNCGSRVITTSRIYKVAEYSDEVCKLQPLPDHHSKELFYEGLSSGGKDICNLDETEEQCITEILKKCGGVPLALITMASLLANKPKEDWPEVYKSIGFGDEENGDVKNTRMILKFSYDDLPHHLKTCLLLLSTFPKDREIERNTLVWRWVAEGLVHEEKGKTLFMVGESYFNQLIDRSLLQPVEGTSYTIHLCRVHDMVLDMICSVAKEDNFVSTMLDSIEQHPPCSENVVGRLCVRKGIVTQQDLAQTCIPKQVRSFNASECCFLFDLMSLRPSFQFLRLLSMEHCLLTGDHLVQSITGCHHLRYLGLSGTAIGELPRELGHFRYLQTLDLRGTALKALPQSVTLLTQLKCLRSEGTEMALPDGMGDLTSLEELRLDNVVNSPNFVKDLGKLTNLRILHIGTYMFGDSLNEALVESLSRLKKIEELELCDGGDCKAPTWHNFSPSRELRHLRLHNIRHSHGLPEWINPSFLPHLCHLNVHVKSAEAQHLVNLGNFQELASLCLFIDRHQISTDAIAAGAYPKLQYYCMLLPRKFLPGAMPCLQTVDFRFHAANFRDLKPNLDSLANLPLLMRVHVKINCWDVTVQVAKAAEAAVRQAIRLHDKRPILVLERIGSCVDYFELKSKSDIENVLLYKLLNRVRQFQREEGDLDWDEMIDDPTDPEVIRHHLNFQVQLPSMIESIFDEMIDDGLPSMIQSVLNEMLAECRQREGGASSSRQAISRNSNSEALVASMIKSVIKKIKPITNVIEGGPGGASNSEQLDSSDIEALLQDSNLKRLTSLIKSMINGRAQFEELDSEPIDTTDQEISGSSSKIGEVLMKSIFDCQMYEGNQGGEGESNFEQIDSIDKEAISRNLNFNGLLPSIHESILDEILDQGSIDESILDEILEQGLPLMVESVLNEMLDEHRQREAGASGSQKVISRNSNFHAPLRSMIKSIIKELLDEGGQGDLEVISHDPDLKDAFTSVIKSRIDNWAQGEVKESDSEHIDTTDQEINRGSSSNTGAVRMKTLLISQMYQSKLGGVEESNSKHTNSRGKEVISHNSNSNAALHSVLFESILRESNSENMNSAHPQGDLSSSSASIVESTKVMEGLADEDIIVHTLNKKGGKVVDAVSKETIKLIKTVQTPTVSYLTGSIDSLVKKLAELKTHTKFEALHEDLVSLKKDFFDKLASNGRPVVNLQVKVWIKQLRELVFDIEDWIDGNKDTIKWDPKDMEEKTKEFNTLIKEARCRCIRYDLLVKAGTDVAGLSLAPSKVIAVDSPVLWGDKAFDVVGLGGLKQMLKEHLLHEHKMLKVVSIIGTGGLGKTTLAKELHGELQAEFSCGAFIHIGRSPSVRTILVNILHQTMSYSDRKVYFKAPPKRDDVDFLPLWEREHEVVLEKQLDKQQVVALLWRHLSQKRYFIVLDDIWSIRYWRAISGALPDNSLGSRILTTTRIMDVAKSCSPGRNNVVHHMKPLSQVESKRLLYEKEGRPADDEILKMCCGIPFAIILAAGTRKYEEHVGLKMPGKSIFSLNQYPTLDGMTSILHIIYADLSLPVRSCLLYLAVFPENYTIKKNRLIQLWGAEGFIPEETRSNDGIRDTEQLWKTGESYFNELISRGLTQPVVNYDDYEAVGCTVLPVVLDFIRSLCREENFATMASELESGSSSVDTIRRFSLDSSNEDVAGVLASSRVYVSSIRSLTVFKDVEGMFTVPSYSPTDILPSTSENLPSTSVPVNLVPAFKLTRVLDLLAGFKLMRVLDLEDTRNLENRHLIGIGGLVLLRFLGIGGTGIDQVPEEIGKLMQLETLDLRLNRLPASIVNLENLMHLHIDMYFAGQEMSEELQELDKVTNLLRCWNRLRMLGLTLDARYLTTTIPRSVASFFEEVFKSNLESLSLHFPFGPYELLSLLVDSWKKVTPSPAARVVHPRFEPRRFELIISEVNSTGVPLKMASLLHLTHLCIKLFSVDDEVLGILGGLPKLFLLKLSSAYRPPDLGGCIITEDVFPCLKVASFKGQMGLVFQKRAMPQLQMLSFHTSKGHFYDGIDRLTCLTRVHAIISHYGATDSETKTWEARIREQVSLNPNKLALKFIRAYEETMSYD